MCPSNLELGLSPLVIGFDYQAATLITVVATFISSIFIEIATITTLAVVATITESIAFLSVAITFLVL
jgi:hypothetical protein